MQDYTVSIAGKKYDLSKPDKAIRAIIAENRSAVPISLLKTFGNEAVNRAAITQFPLNE